jgi:tetratricopeptide (TPR) repeat protein
LQAPCDGGRVEADADGETSHEQLLAALNDRLDQFVSGDTAVLGEAEVSAVADALGAVPGNLETTYALGLFHHYRLIAGLAGQDRDDATRALGYFAAVFRQAPDLVPEGVRELVGDTWKPDADDVSTWRLRAQHLLQDPRRFRLPDLFSDAIYLLQLTLGTGMLSLQAQAASMTSLVIAYAGRFEATGDLTALDGAADAAARCVEVTEPADPNLPGRRSNLAAALATRFDHRGAMEDLERTIARLWIAVDAAAPDERTGYLANLGGALLLRYRHSGDTASLNQAVECARRAVSSIDAGYRQRPRMLGTLALALRTRFQRRGDRPDIDAAVNAIEEAVQATEAGHPDEAGHLSALSTALRVRFGASEAASDIDRAVKAARAAAHAAQGDSDARVKSLSNLGAALSARFRMGGDPADLDDAVTAQAEAAELASPDDPVRATILANLGLSLRQRAGHSQNRRDELRPAARAHATSGAVDGAPAMVRATGSYDAGVILAELEDWPAAVEQFQRSVECLSAVVDHRRRKPAKRRAVTEHRLTLPGGRRGGGA